MERPVVQAGTGAVLELVSASRWLALGLPMKLKYVKLRDTPAAPSTPALLTKLLTLKIIPKSVRVPSNNGRMVSFLPVLPQRSRTYS